MIIKQKEYLDKVRACFMGKNIGGTLGTPVEGKRGVFNIEFYTHDTSKGALPNDDLDLQLVWLVAAERYGNKVNSQILADYWAARIYAHWNEYGQGKVNVKNGLVPPVSGAYHNPMKDSNGAWIRSEIWACLCPGHPELAVQYAFEDSSVDHADEGIYAEVFTAALESAAFVEKDFEKLVDIALSYLPADCAIAGVVRLVQKCKKDGLTWREARKEVLTQYPDGFVHHVLPCEPEDVVPVGKKGFDAPANIGIVMIGWLYGEGDFAKTLCTAANCGEDGDCTCATLGALWGILHGMDGIPQKWIEPIGEDIKVGCVDMTHEGTLIPKTISALTKRVANLMPAFMTHNVDITAEDGFEISALEGDKLFDSYELPKDLYVTTHNFKELCEIRNPMSCKVDSPFLTTYLVYNNGIEISEGVETSFKLVFKPNFRQGWADVKINMPADWEVKPGHKAMLPYGMYYDDYSEHEIRFTPHNLTEGMYEFGIEIRVGEVRIPRFVPVTLIVK
ncbi:MAG: ADP-ribosylglycohydrolase family protein [Clostridia bacterium]|nr:ADP-ribosylglycohydrolase family protein [Clostridia bacterium]